MPHASRKLARDLELWSIPFPGHPPRMKSSINLGSWMFMAPQGSPQNLPQVLDGAHDSGHHPGGVTRRGGVCEFSRWEG